MSEQLERKRKICLNDFDIQDPSISYISKEARTAGYCEIMNHLYGRMDIEKVASRYESKIHDSRLLNTGQLDPNRLRDQVRVLLHNDSPSTLVGEIFSLPRRPWHESYKASGTPTHRFSCDSTALNPINTDSIVNGPKTTLAGSDFALLHGKCLTNHHLKMPILSTKHRLKIDVSLLRKQHRLVQLGHAAICTNDFEKNGPCHKSHHCAKLKKLWGHLSKCHDDKCKVQHCFSSRYILGHYCRCKDSKCVVCEPARRQATKYNKSLVPNNSNLRLTNTTTTVSENDNLTKESSREGLHSEDTASHDSTNDHANSIYITNLQAFASDVSGEVAATKRHSLSSVSALSPSTGEKLMHFQPNDALDVAFFLSRLKQQDA